MLTLVASTCLSTSTPAALLEANRVAMRSSAPSTLISSYHFESEGMIGSASSVIDTATGRYIERDQAGLSTESEGFDGVTPWMQDLSNFYSPQEGGNKPALAINRAYLNANGWWRSDRARATIKAIDCNSIEVTPPGSQPFRASFDPTTHLLATVSEQYVFGHVRETRFGDYRPCGDTLVPGRIEIISDSDSATRQIRELEKCSSGPPKPKHFFALPRISPTDWSLPPTGRAILTMRPHDTDVMISARINGRGPYLFYLDSGGHDIISPRLAKELGLQVAGEGRSGGAGDKTVETGYAKVAEIDAGGAILKNQTVIVLETSPPDVVGELIGGVLGVEFFERFLTTIDYERNKVTFEDPAKFSLTQQTSAGIPVPFKLYDHMPQVEGTFEDLGALYNIDTGSGQFLDLTRPYVEAHALQARYPGAVTIVSGFGTGGASHSTVVRAQSLGLGAAKVANVPVGLSTALHGSFSDPVYSGNVGNGVLRHFRVTFDYPRKTMYLAPVKNPDLSAYGFNRTGITIILQHGKPTVVDVAAGTPGVSSGIEPGDIITSIGGTDVSTLFIRQIRQLLKEAPTDRPMSLSYIRGGSPKETSLIPRDLVPN